MRDNVAQLPLPLPVPDEERRMLQMKEQFKKLVEQGGEGIPPFTPADLVEAHHLVHN